MLSLLLSALYVFVCLLLLVVVLLQQGKGGDIAAAFGGGGSQAAFGARAGATILTRGTTILGALFMVGAFVLAIVGQREPSSVVGGFDGAPVTPIGTEAVAETPFAADDAEDAAADEENSDGNAETPAAPQ